MKLNIVTLLVTIVGSIIPIIGWIFLGIMILVLTIIEIICFFDVCGGKAKEYAFPDRNFKGEQGYIGKVRCTECGKSVETFGHDIREALVMAKSYWCRGIYDV